MNKEQKQKQNKNEFCVCEKCKQTLPDFPVMFGDLDNKTSFKVDKNGFITITQEKNVLILSISVLEQLNKRVGKK
jgi:hypothetical protein